MSNMSKLYFIFTNACTAFVLYLKLSRCCTIQLSLDFWVVISLCLLIIFGLCFLLGKDQGLVLLMLASVSVTLALSFLYWLSVTAESSLILENSFFKFSKFRWTNVEILSILRDICREASVSLESDDIIFLVGESSTPEELRNKFQIFLEQKRAPESSLFTNILGYMLDPKVLVLLIVTLVLGWQTWSVLSARDTITAVIATDQKNSLYSHEVVATFIVDMSNMSSEIAKLNKANASLLDDHAKLKGSVLRTFLGLALALYNNKIDVSTTIVRGLSSILVDKEKITPSGTSISASGDITTASQGEYPTPSAEEIRKLRSEFLDKLFDAAG